MGKERPPWIRGAVKDTFWDFVDQKWKESLNVVAAEPVSWDHGMDFRHDTDRLRKGES
jgi:hypothetical protein